MYRGGNDIFVSRLETAAAAVEALSNEFIANGKWCGAAERRRARRDRDRLQMESS